MLYDAYYEELQHYESIDHHHHHHQHNGAVTSGPLPGGGGIFNFAKSLTMKGG